jgi:hypothetical protein
LLRRIPDERVADSAVGNTAIGDDKLGHAVYGDRPFTDNGCSAAAGGFGSGVVAVVVGREQGHVDIARANMADVVGAAGNADVARADRQIVGQNGTK